MSKYSDAIISEDGVYRYTLDRVWDITLPILGYIMLNPSTADKTTNDPTTLECTALAKRWGYGGITLRNLFAFRATKPIVMMQASDPVGPDNNKHIIHFLTKYSTIILAWGARGDFRSRHAEVLSMIERARPTFKGVFCLGRNNNGQPTHPLGAVGVRSLIPWNHTHPR